MRFGDLTPSDKYRLEDRTAFFFNWCGVVAQRHMRAWGKGVSTRVLHKVLANVLIDVHWMVEKDVEKFAFAGVGEFVWAPNKFGGLGEIIPVTYHKNVPLAFGFFPTLVDAVQWSHFRKYGFQRVVRRNNQNYLVFANDIDYKTREKSAVKLNEQLFWEKLTTIYVDAALTDEDRDALASCRTATLAFYSMAFQLAHWRRDMRAALIRAVSGSVQNARVALDEAKTAVAQFTKKAGYWRAVSKHRSNVAAVAARTELGSVVPLCEDEIAFSAKLKYLLDFEPAIEYIHAICRNAFAALVQDRVDVQELDRSVRHLSSEYVSLGVVQAEATRWLSRVNERPLRRRDVADRATGLIDRLVREVEGRIDLSVSDLDVFYRELLHERYPLPTAKFRPGF